MGATPVLRRYIDFQKTVDELLKIEETTHAIRSKVNPSTRASESARKERDDKFL